MEALGDHLNIQGYRASLTAIKQKDSEGVAFAVTCKIKEVADVNINYSYRGIKDTGQVTVTGRCSQHTKAVSRASGNDLKSCNQRVGVGQVKGQEKLREFPEAQLYSLV